jgi:hypothetical protein
MRSGAFTPYPFSHPVKIFLPLYLFLFADPFFYTFFYKIFLPHRFYSYICPFLRMFHTRVWFILPENASCFLPNNLNAILQRLFMLSKPGNQVV